jgi:hypothetical protein
MYYNSPPINFHDDFLTKLIKLAPAGAEAALVEPFVGRFLVIFDV